MLVEAGEKPLHSANSGQDGAGGQPHVAEEDLRGDRYPHFLTGLSVR